MPGPEPSNIRSNFRTKKTTVPVIRSGQQADWHWLTGIQDSEPNPNSNVFQQDSQLTPAYFAPFPIFVKKAFKRWQRFFFKKHSWFIVFFSNFPNVQNFLISHQKNLRIKVESLFQEILPFEMHSIKNWPHLAILKHFKFFFENNTSIFQKSSQILNVSRLFTFPLAIYCYILMKKIHVQTWTKLPMFAWTQLANIELKNAPIWEEDFASIFQIWRKTITTVLVVAF